MKCLKLAMVILLLTLLNSCSIYGGAPLPPEWQAILDSMPPDPPGTQMPAIIFPDIEQRMSDSEKSTPSNQMKQVYDNKGNYIGDIKQYGSYNLWSIYDKRGNYLGEIDSSGRIKDATGRYIGDVR